MTSRSLQILSLTAAGLLVWSASARAADKVNYEDHLLPLLRNECTSCHNPDKKKGGLDLSSYQALMAGSDSGPVVNPGDPEGSVLYKTIAHLEDPYMPKGKAKLADKDIDVFKQFIAMGALPNASGKPVVARNKPKLNLAVASADTGKPTGPVAMPKDWIVEPVVHTSRPGAIMCLAASPWAPLVAVGGQHQILMYNTDTLELLGVLPWTEGDPYTARFSRNGAVLIVGGGVAAKSGHVVLYDVNSGNKITTVGDEYDAVLAADLSPDQSTVALGGPGKVLKIYSTADGQLLHSMKKHTDWVTAVGFSPDGVLLASGDRQGGLWVWESKSGNEFYGLTGHKAGITDVCFRGDSNILASASEDGTVKLWDMQSGKNVKTIQAHPGGVASVYFTHDGRLVTCGRDRRVKIWKADGGQIGTTEPFADIALHAVFDGDGKRVVAGDWTGQVRVFDAKTAKPVGELTDDPLPIADRIADAMKRIPEAQAAYDKAAGELAAAQKASDKAGAELQAANLARAEAQKAVEQSKSQEKSTAQAIQIAQADVKTAQELVASKESDADRFAKAAQQAIAPRDAAERERKLLSETVASKQKAADEANANASKAKSAASQSPDDPQLASAAADARSAADRLASELADAQKALGMKGDQVAMLDTQLTKARVEADQAQMALGSARDALKARQATAQKAEADHQAAAALIAKAQQMLTDAEKRVPQRTQEARSAAEQLARVKPVADAAASQLAAAKLQVGKLKLAQFNLSVWSARNDLTTRQGEFEKLNAAADQAKASLEKTNADIAGAQKLIDQGPQLIQAQKDQIAKARQALASAEAARDGARADLAERQALAQQAGELTQKLATAAAKSPDEKALADAAAKAKTALDALSPDIDSATGKMVVKTKAATEAQTAVAAAEASLSKLTADIAGAPKNLVTLKQALAAAGSDLSTRKAAADECAKAVAAAKAHADELSSRYRKMSQEAAAAPVAASPPKG
jgi:WD40 repeat protein/predicted  nucleic acid-binding Zn-ribbon protein